mmetsp:Transcript_124414/g.239989  ORF Transcript_124414/g.239989 Transcript_124414/m.239989 type:complete len:87 (+) Transcript_124414:359-619(+)
MTPRDSPSARNTVGKITTAARITTYTWLATNAIHAISAPATDDHDISRIHIVGDNAFPAVSYMIRMGMQHKNTHPMQRPIFFGLQP